MMQTLLTPKEAYAAMYLFLEELYNKFGFDQLGGILGSMSVLQDGMPADSAIWDDWLRMVERGKGPLLNIGLQIGDEDASRSGGLT